MSEAQRAILLRASAALYGFAVAISLHDFILRPAPLGQLPGRMTTLGYDAQASFRFIGLIIALPIVFAFILNPIARLLARSGVQRWARNAALITGPAAMWTVAIARDPLWVTLPGAVAIGVAVALRHFAARFRRIDVVLLPSALALFIALTELTSRGVHQCVILAVAIVLTIRVGIVAFRRKSGLEPSLCFALAPLAFIPETHFFSYDQRHLGWPALGIVILTPVIMRAAVSRSPRIRAALRTALAWCVYPLACYAYLSASSLLNAEGKPRVSLFEASEHIVPAAQMIRGERLYQDVIPPHGLIQDGLLDYLLMRRGAANIGQLLKARGTISALNSVAQYALGVAMTGSAAGGVLTFFLAAAFGLGGGTFRVLPALLTLILTIGAVQRRRPSILGYAAAGVVLSVLTSLDFGTYAAVSLAVAVVRFPGSRTRAIRHASIGLAAALLVAAIALQLGGILVPFVRVTLTEIGPLASVYALPPFQAPPEIVAKGFFPDVLANLFTAVYPYVVWPIIVIFLAVALSSPRAEMSIRRRARKEAFVVLASFAVVSAISYAERHHLYFQFVTPALLLAMLMAVAHARVHALRLFAPVMAIVLLMIAQPTIHLGIVAWLRHQRGPLEPQFCEASIVPRARGALFRERDAAVIEAANVYQSTRLQPGETFFDFTNRGLLYYLFDRDCPIRQVEVAFYETERLQREVIEAIERNPRIRAALVPPPNDDTGIDLVPNPQRAPLVWQYLQQHFTPDYAEGGVVFWRRQ